MRPDKVNLEKCTICGLCTELCDYGVLLINENKKRLEIYDKNCLECSHCIAICPVSALSAKGQYPDKIEDLPVPNKTLAMLNKRRSIRKYLDKPVETEKLDKLADFARYAPTGSNRQGTRVLFVVDKEKRKQVTDALMKFYKKMKKIISIWPFSLLMYFFVPRKMVKSYKAGLKHMVKKFEDGKDVLFFNSPVIVFVYSLKHESSTPKDDACYALYNMVIGAESMGMGTCINQLSVIAYNKMKKKILKLLGLPKTARIQASSSLGYPHYKFKSAAIRQPAKFEIL